MLVVALAVKAPEVVLPMGPDQGTYNVLGETILAGRPLYRDAWDNQTPGVYLVHAALLAVLPHAWIGQCLAVPAPLGCTHLGMHAFDLLYSLAVGATLYGVARGAGWGATTAALASILGVGFGGLSLLNREGSTPEKLALLPTALAAGAYLQFRVRGGIRWLVLAGLFLGVASVFRPTASVLGGAMVIHALMLGERSRRGRITDAARIALALAGCGLAVWAPLVGLLALTGALDGFLEVSFGYNAARVALDASGSRVDALSGVRDHLKAMLAGTGVLWVAGVAGAVGLVLAFRRLRAFVGLWALADLSLLLVVHEYVQLVASLSLAAAWAVSRTWQALGTPRSASSDRIAGRLLLVGLSVMALVATNGRQAAVTLRAWNERVPPRFTASPDEHLASFVRGEARGEPVFIWGEAANVYVLSGQSHASRFINLVPLARPVPGVHERRSQLLAELRARPPGLFLLLPPQGRLDPRDDMLSDISTFPQLTGFLDRCYAEERMPDRFGRWRMFRLIEATACQ